MPLNAAGNEGVKKVLALAAHDSDLGPNAPPVQYEIPRLNTGKSLRVTLYDPAGNYVVPGGVANVTIVGPLPLAVIDTGHQNIHDGISFNAAASGAAATIAGGASARYEITTPNSALRVHMLFDITGAQPFKAFLINNSALINLSALTIPPRNRNANAAPVPTTTIQKGDLGAVGSPISAFGSLGSGANFSVHQVRTIDEIILLPNAKYALELQNVGAQASEYVVNFNWYEI